MNQITCYPGNLQALNSDLPSYPPTCWRSVTTLCISPTKPSGTAARFGRLGFSKCDCPLVAAAFPIPKCDCSSLTLSNCRKPRQLTGLRSLCSLLVRREPLTLSCIFLPKYLSPETLLTVKEIYHSLFAFSFPD